MSYKYKLLCRYEQILELVGLPILRRDRPVLQPFCRSHMKENYNIQGFPCNHVSPDESQIPGDEIY